MNQATPPVRDLAKQLLALEAHTNEPSETTADAALRAFEKLRLHLSKLVGIAGFQALLTRALALAKAEIPWLEIVLVNADGALEGFSESVKQDADAAAGMAALLGQLLGLLVTFIGKDLTLLLVRDVWWDAPLNEMILSVEETSK